MTCCVAINAKEGDCWTMLSLMSHKCHISHQSQPTELKQSAMQSTVLTELLRLTKKNTVSIKLTRSLKERWRSQFLPSSLGHRKKNGEDSFYQAHSVIKGNEEKSMLTERHSVSKG